MSEHHTSGGFVDRLAVEGGDDSWATFRVGTSHDAARIAEYYHRCWLTASASQIEPDAAARLDSSMWLDLFRDRLSPDSSMRTIVAVLGDVVVGHVQVEGNLLVHLFVDPDHQSRGIGGRMLGIGEQLVAGDGFAEAELHTRVDNARAIALYDSAGWRLTDRVLHSAHDGIEYDEHVMVKDLSAASARCTASCSRGGEIDMSDERMNRMSSLRSSPSWSPRK